MHSEHLRSAKGGHKARCGCSCHCREQSSTYDGQADRDKSTLKVELRVEPRLQPKIARLAHQAAVNLGSTG